MRSFPEVPNGFNVKSFSQTNGSNVKSFSIESNTNKSHSKPSADGDQSIASATDLFKSMMINELAEEQHSYSNQSYLLDKTIDKAAKLLTENAKPFEKEIDNFIATQSEIDAMVSNIPTPKSKHNKNLIPMVLLLMQSINGTVTNRPLVALCDSGSSHCMFNKRALPFGATTFKTPKIKTTTTQGTYDCDEAVVLSNLSLPEFVNGRKITNLSAQVFDSENCHYDIILGRDFMESIGLDIQFSTGSIKWLDTIVDMKHISMYDHIKKDITNIGIQANNRDAMLAWRSYQEDILYDELDRFDSILDEFEEFNECLLKYI